MDRIAHMVGEKAGEAVEGAVKHVLGVKDTDKKKGGGGLSWFGSKKKEEPVKPDEGKGGFFSKLLDKGEKDRGDKGVKKTTGFQGLFAEQQGAGETEGGVCEYSPSEGPSGDTQEQGAGFYDDLVDVAAELSTDK